MLAEIGIGNVSPGKPLWVMIWKSSLDLDIAHSVESTFSGVSIAKRE